MGVQAFGTHWLLVHVSPATQVPQSRLPPHLSPITPQYFPAPEPQVTGLQPGPPLHR
jgi:hypothetical protein